MCIFVDGFSKYIHVYLHKSTTQFLEALKELVLRIETEKGKKEVVAQLIADSATYFEKSAPVQLFCSQKGIIQLYSPPYTQSLNGLAERTIRTVIEMARTMLMHSSVPSHFYGDAIQYTVYILNRLPYRTGSATTRIERWLSRAVSDPTKHIRVFGCAAWVHRSFDTGPSIDKLGPKTQEGFLLGIDERRQAYKVCLLHNKSVIHSGHVIFNEEQFPCSKDSSMASTSPVSDFVTPPSTPAPVTIPQAVRRSTRPRELSAPALRNIPDVDIPPSDVSDTVCVSTTHSAPRNIHEALAGPEADKWLAALHAEVRSHEENETFGPPLQDIPPGFTPIALDTILKLKRDGRTKVRAVVRGYRMMQGRDYNETFAPTPNVVCFKLLLAYAAMQGWRAVQGDSHTAFLIPRIDHEVYLLVPDFFSLSTTTTSVPTTKSYRKAFKAFPGAPQSSRLWHKHVRAVTAKAGLTASQIDPSLYFNAHHSIYLVAWVDDVFMFFPPASLTHAERTWQALQPDLKLDPWADIDDCLGCKVTVTEGLITLSQEKAVRDLVAAAGLSDSKPVATPMAQGVALSAADCPSAAAPAARIALDADQTWYRSTIASCIYFSTWTRPDIAYAVSKLCRYMHNPGRPHITALKHLLRYLNATATLGITYRAAAANASSVRIHGYYDAAHADDIDNRPLQRQHRRHRHGAQPCS